MKSKLYRLFESMMVLWVLFHGVNTKLYGENPPVMKAHKIALAPVMDGELNDACWKDTLAMDFVLLDNKGVPQGRTEGYLVYDENALYIGFKCHEPRMDKLMSGATGRNSLDLYGDDTVEVFLGIHDDEKTYYHFTVNPLGTKRCVLVDKKNSRRSRDWNSCWEAKTHRGKDGWTAELSIPFAALDIAPDVRSVWRINLNRTRRFIYENSSWAPMVKTFHDPARFGLLELKDINLSRYGSVRLGDMVCEKQWGDNRFKAKLENMTNSAVSVNAAIIASDSAGAVVSNSVLKELEAGETGDVEIGYPVKREGVLNLRCNISDARDGWLLKCWDEDVVIPAPLEIAMKHPVYYLNETPAVGVKVNVAGSWLKELGLNVTWSKREDSVPLAEVNMGVIRGETEVPFHPIRHKQGVGEYLITVKLMDNHGKIVSSATNKFSIAEKIW